MAERRVMSKQAFALALLLSVSRTAESYKQIANCVPGGIVAGLEQTRGLIGLYTVALQKIIPTYKDLTLIAEGPTDACLSAANAINSNQFPGKNRLRMNPTPGFYDEFPEETPLLDDFPDLKELGIRDVLHKGDEKKSYLYVFTSKDYHAYPVIADCVPGGVVADLNETEGRIGLYTVALQKLLPGLVGDLHYLGVTNDAGHCLDAMNRVNSANATISSMKTSGDLASDPSEGVHEVDVQSAFSKADREMTYLYAFKNKFWNEDDGLLNLADPVSQANQTEYIKNRTDWLKAHHSKTSDLKALFSQFGSAAALASMAGGGDVGNGAIAGLLGKALAAKTEHKDTPGAYAVESRALINGIGSAAQGTSSGNLDVTTLVGDGASDKIGGLLGGLFKKNKAHSYEHTAFVKIDSSTTEPVATTTGVTLI